MTANRYAVVGPPGCGKTTFLKRQVERAAASLGSEQIVVGSLTRAAAAEIRGRDIPVPPQQVGTLHALAYRALGCPKIAESKLDEWNAAHPEMRLSKAKSVSSPENDKEDEASADEAPGDELYEQVGLLRHRRVQEEGWRVSQVRFHKAWQAWLADTGYLDFTGLIETALDQVDEAPGRPLAFFVDEAQDLSALEVGLVQKWSAGCPHVVVVGDPAQALYEWRGAAADGFFDVGDAAHRRVLSQSYRVPQAAHRRATAWGRPLLHDIVYNPTEKEGSVAFGSTSMRYGDVLVEMAEHHLSDPGSGTLMIQALCSYMLRSLVAALRERGVPFHNPNRTVRGDWNPLARRKGVSTPERLRAFMTEEQTVESFLKWLPMLQVKDILVKGAKERAASKPPETIEEVCSLFAGSDALNHAFSGNTDWLKAHVTAEYAKRLPYPLAVIKRYGLSGLDETPRVMVGTIHSFKGAEADHVVVAPDLSPAAFEEHFSGSLGVTRAFYVALTRTRDRLTILPPSSMRCVDLHA